MARQKIDITLLPFISRFEQITHAKVKFCMEDMRKDLVYIIDPTQMGLALGRKASNIPKVERSVRRNIKVVAFAEDVQGFVHNLLFPLKGFDVQRNGDSVEIVSDDKKVKGAIMGRDRQNLKNYEFIVKNFFPIQQLVVK